MPYKTSDEDIKKDKLFIYLDNKVKKLFPNFPDEKRFELIACIARKHKGESCHRTSRKGGYDYDLYIGTKDVNLFVQQKKIASMLGYRMLMCRTKRGYYICKTNAPSATTAIDRINEIEEKRKERIQTTNIKQLIDEMKSIKDEIMTIRHLIQQQQQYSVPTYEPMF